MEIGARRRCVDVAEALGRLSPGDPPALQWVVAELRQLSRAEKGLACGLQPSETRPSIDFVHADGLSAERFGAELQRVMDANPRGFTIFDPSAPDERQRNVPLTGEEMTRLSGVRSTPVTAEVFPKVGLTRLEQLRVLVCDGANLLTWLGVLRDDPFTTRERWLVNALIAPLRRRLVLERRLAAGALAEAGLAAVMERLGSPAFLLTRQRIAYGNAAAEALRREDASIVEALLRGDADRVGFDEVRVAVRGLPEHRLVVRRRDLVADARHRAAAASRGWRLTPRETSVLALIARGLCNKDIASALGCAESTTEVHVTSLLRKAGCCGRAELVARFWTESFDRT